MRPWIVTLSLALAVGVACRPAPELPVLARIDRLELETSRGDVISESDLEGRIQVVDFIFTSCQMACPLMTTRMKRLYEEFDDGDEVRFLSVSTDPATDTVEVLREYAERFGVDERRWVFGRAEKEELVRLSEEEFLLGAAGFPVGHSLKFVLVDRERRIRGYYDSEDAEALERLRRDLRGLL